MPATSPPAAPGPAGAVPVDVAAGGLRARAERHPVGVVWFGVVLFSLSPVLVAGATLPGVAFSFWRLWLGVAALGAVTLARRRLTALAPTGEALVWVVVCGLTFAIHQLAFMTALRQTSVVDVTLMNTVAPVVVAVLAVPLFGERPGVRFRVWSAVAMSGAAAVVLAGSSGADGDPLGMALAVVNVAFYAVYFVGTKAARPHVDTAAFLFAVIVVAALAVSLWVVLTGTPVGPVSGPDLLRCAGVAVLSGALGHFSITWSLRWVPANLPPVIMLAIPVLSGASAWALLGQEVTVGQVLAGGATLVGVLGAVRSPSAARLGAPEAAILAEET